MQNKYPDCKQCLATTDLSYEKYPQAMRMIKNNSLTKIKAYILCNIQKEEIFMDYYHSHSGIIEN